MTHVIYYLVEFHGVKLTVSVSRSFTVPFCVAAESKQTYLYTVGQYVHLCHSQLLLRRARTISCPFLSCLAFSLSILYLQIIAVTVSSDVLLLFTTVVEGSRIVMYLTG